jgi:hypothetical protein
MKVFPALLLSLPLLSLAACTAPADPAPESEGADAGQIDDPTCQGDECLPEPASGLQVITKGVEIMPGQDVEYCEVVQLPGSSDTVYYMNRFESKMTPGSHHLIVSAAPPDSNQAADLQVGDQYECPGGTFGGDFVPVGGSQKSYGDDSFPEGVGRIFHGGQKLVVNYHYLNISDSPVNAVVQLNLHTTTEDKIQFIARSFGFFNVGFKIDPGMSDSVFTECTFSEDITISQLTRHTHRWGTDFNVWYVGGEKDGELVFSSEHYEDTDHSFEEPITAVAGTGFRFECAYENTETYPLTFGLKASDEMCILFGTWWNANGEAPNQGCFRN